LIEAKGPGYEQLFRDLSWKGEDGPVGVFTEEVVAKGKIARDFGCKIEYRVAEEYAADEMSNIVARQNLADTISVIFTP
jgi:hypothetical protein